MADSEISPFLPKAISATNYLEEYVDGGKTHVLMDIRYGSTFSAEHICHAISIAKLSEDWMPNEHVIVFHDRNSVTSLVEISTSNTIFKKESLFKITMDVMSWENINSRATK